MLKYFIDCFKSIKVFFGTINFNKITTKLLFYCVLSFYLIVNISHAGTIFINFYCELIVMKLSQSYNLTHFIVFACFLFQMNFSFFIFVSTDCSLVKMISYYLNPNLVLNLYVTATLQFMGWILFCLLVHIYVSYSLRNILL